MNQQVSSAAGAQNRTTVERKGDRELVVTRTFDAPPQHGVQGVEPARAVPALVGAEVGDRQFRSCRAIWTSAPGGKYRLEFGAGGSETMAFYGKYLDVVPDERIVWTNDEGEEGAVTTVTFEDQDGKTLLTFHEVYPSKEALEEAHVGLRRRPARAARPARTKLLADRGDRSAPAEPRMQAWRRE